MWPLELGLGTPKPRSVAWPLQLGLGTHNPRSIVWPLQLGLGTHNPCCVAWRLELGLGTHNPRFGVPHGVGVRDSQCTLRCGPWSWGYGLPIHASVWPFELGLGTRNKRCLSAFFRYVRQGAVPRVTKFPPSTVPKPKPKSILAAGESIRRRAT